MQNQFLRSFAKDHKLIAAVVLCWLFTIGIGYKAFFYQDQLFTVSLIGKLPPRFNTLLGVVICLLPLGIFFFKGKKLWYGILIIGYSVFCLADVNRLTPYFICYLGFFGVMSYHSDDTFKWHKALLLIAAGIYIFSGLHKFNEFFTEEILKKLWFYFLPVEPTETIGKIVAGIEVFLGLSLLFKRTRKIACLFLAGMHVILLWKSGPLKLNWNLIVWPWNICMLCILWYVYRSSLKLEAFLKGNSFIEVVVGIFFFVIPLLSVFDLAPINMGFKLYSGGSYSPYLKVEKKIDRLKRYDYTPDSNSTVINIQTMAIYEQHLAINPEPWIYKRIVQNFTREFKVSTQIVPKPEINEKN